MDPRFPQPHLRDEFRRELRARLIAQANATLPRAARRDTAWVFSFLRPALAVGLAALVLVAGGGAAAAGSLPGDPAFGLKKAIEDLQLALTFDEVQRLRLLADITDRRLHELELVVDRSDRAPTASEEYARAVERFRAAVDALKQSAPADKADAAQEVADNAREKHEAVLDEIEQRVPDEAKPALQRARDEEHRDADGDGREPKGGASETEQPARTGEPSRTREPSESPEPSRSPRASATPRETPRPEPSAQPSDRDDD